MAVQTTYSRDHDAAFLGQVVDSNDTAIMSGLAEVEILPGRGVMQGTAANEVKIPTATGAAFKGVAVRSLDIEAKEDGSIVYDIGEEVALLTRGRIAVEADETVVAGDPVFLVHTGGDEGRFRNDTTDADQVAGAVFLTGGNAGDIVTINIPSAVA